MEENKYLALARGARKNHNKEMVGVYYNKAKEEMSNNGEVEFFSAYYDILKSEKGQAYKKYMTFTETIEKSIRYVALSDYSDQEKKEILQDMAFATKLMPTLIYNLYDGSEQTTNGNSKSIAMLYGFGLDVETYFCENKSIMSVAVSMWNAGIELQYKWAAVPFEKEAPAEYGAKIHQYDPAFQLPKENKIRSFLLRVFGFLVSFQQK